MSQAPYSWVFTGTCLVCGSPIYGRVRKGEIAGSWYRGKGANPETTDEPLEVAQDEPEARRTCPSACPYGPGSPTPRGPEIVGHSEHAH